MGFLNIRCGKKQITWTKLGIAAARMKSYLYEQRQYFPSISHILELDRLRENAANVLTNEILNTNPDATNHPMIRRALELVSEKRRLHATNPRDKIHALANMFIPEGSRVVPLDCASPVEKVYIDFAWWLLRTVDGLQILKHCGLTNYDLPSWVPDWSIDLEYLPLPSSKDRPFGNTSWWSKPGVVIFAYLKDYVDNCTIRGPGKSLLWFTEVPFSVTMLSQLKGYHHYRSFRAGGSTKASKSTPALILQGIIWDTIGEIHGGFVPDVDDNFDNTTKFMVALGQCKLLAEDSASATLRYPSLEGRLRAFWITILAGQRPESDRDAKDSSAIVEVDYMTWLPPISHS
ncbi:hypothetical protein F4818DRAFT_443558 [Hypoxylon cercidicola]|nr:hypothetical protein F4818DRAFT_443558 [Hypoxylon cercidicola]